MLFRSKKKALNTLDPKAIPAHVAIIMDGNGRWAQKRGLPRKAGHSAGSETFRNAAYYMAEVGVKYLTIYALSTENWSRPRDEVDAILALLEKYLRESVEEMQKKNIRLFFWGDESALSPELRRLIAQTQAINRQTTGMCVNVCLNYGGRDELVRAARSLARRCQAGELAPEEITQQTLSGALYSAGVPDPDLLIRPGGEKRISNFLLWQTAYTEYYFTDTLWPDMDNRQLELALLAYQNRNRRFGGLKDAGSPKP